MIELEYIEFLEKETKDCSDRREELKTSLKNIHPQVDCDLYLERKEKINCLSGKIDAYNEALKKFILLFL